MSLYDVQIPLEVGKGRSKKMQQLPWVTLVSTRVWQRPGISPFL